MNMRNLSLCEWKICSSSTSLSYIFYHKRYMYQICVLLFFTIFQGIYYLEYEDVNRSIYSQMSN